MSKSTKSPFFKTHIFPLIRPYRHGLPKTLTHLLVYGFRLHKFHYFCILALGIVWAFYVSFMPYFTKHIIDAVATNPQNPDAMLNAAIIPASGFFCFYMAVNLSFRIRDYVALKSIPSMQRTLFIKLSSYLKRHSHQYFLDKMAGDLANKVSDIVRGTQVIFQMLESFFMQSIAIIIAIIMMYYVHPYFALVLMSWSLIFLAVTIALSKHSQNYAKAFSQSRSKVSGRLVDIIQNITSTRIFSRNEYEESYLEQYLHDTEQKDQHLQFFMLKCRIFQALVTASLIGLMLTVLIYTRYHGHVSVGDFALVLGLSMTISGMVWVLGLNLVQFSRELGICTQALRSINTPHDIVDLPEAKDLSVSKGSIQFNNVSFSYDNKTLVFNDMNLSIEPGQHVGLVGFSGGGKTSFINLILRLFSLNQGQILIDNQDISEVTRQSLRQHISYIPQDPSLFHRTIMENIRYGDLNATDEQVIQAAKQAQCHEFISALPNGYNTIAGERGARFSGGQCQRIIIARALLRNAPIFIMDEATSALDVMTESEIQASLAGIIKDKTTLIVAHRLSTLKKMDRILVFKDGTIVEDGTLEELKQKNQHFTTLWNQYTNNS